MVFHLYQDGANWFRVDHQDIYHPTEDYSDPDIVSGAGTSGTSTPASSVLAGATKVLLHRIVFSSTHAAPAAGLCTIYAFDETTILDVFDCQIDNNGAPKWIDVGMVYNGPICAQTDTAGLVVSVLYSRIV